ncbi:DHA2 family lincomycin resistance protein-like MFS transporter [Lysinibacillus composti]|uniref:DHA2 family efflux MFS transporter permease subunit n=1 Tax=Lysinibacillus composti TaxID=720633 RepID=A0A3N9UA11_9BACI|nr:MDR family MFS transporter [Lysinibacillus composti]MBM7610050.1 DHA2 family lincomycin resistance protein-like MFS transporter [Lysinibacillus composti]RQW73311.1 DHA2 family efflux MFS transporter permease subunit [Lysinibacillus composti]
MSNLYEKRNKIVIPFLISAFIGLFNETALNMAFVEIGKGFGIEPSTVQWLTTGYLLILGVFVPVSSFLMQRFTTRQLFGASLSLSIIGTLIAAFAPSFSVLLIARIFQALGTAIILPLMMTVILMVYPVEKRGAAMGKIGLVIVFAPAIGPTLAGVILETFTWHFIFWVTIPFLLIALFVGLKFIVNVSEVQPTKLDVLSFILSTIGFGGVVYGFSISGDLGTFMTTEVYVAVGIGLVALLLFAIRQFKLETPMLNLKVFKYPMYTLGLLIILAVMMTLLSVMVLLPIYLQNALLLAPMMAGLLLLPGGVINALLSVVAGNLFDKYGPKLMVPVGLGLTIISLIFLSMIGTDTSNLTIIIMHILLLIGLSFIMMPAQTNGLNQLPRELYTDGTAIMNTLQQVAGAIGTAIAVTVMSITANGYDNPLTGLVEGVQNSILLGLIISVAAFVLSFFIKRVSTVQGH